MTLLADTTMPGPWLVGVTFAAILLGTIVSLRTWIWLEMQEAPIDWIMKQNSLTVRRSSLCVGLFATVVSCILFADGSEIWPMSLTSAMISFAVSAFATESRSYLISAIGFCICMTIAMWMPTFSDDHVFRHRAMGVLCIFWRIGLPVHAKRMTACIICQGLMTVVECLATWTALSRHGEHENVARITVMIFNLSISGTIYSYCSVSHWTALSSAELALSDARQKVAFEKEAADGILSVVCDATFWLAADGDMILSTNGNLEAILGSGLEGTKLSSKMQSMEAARFQALTQRQGNPVHLLNATEFHSNEHRITADLFVVDRRQHRTLEKENEPGFFIGLRLGQLLDMGAAPSDAASGEDFDSAQSLVGNCTDTNRPFSNSSRSSRIPSRAPSVRHVKGAASIASSGTFVVETQNTFLTVTKRSSHHPVRRPLSAPASLCGDSSSGSQRETFETVTGLHETESCHEGLLETGSFHASLHEFPETECFHDWASETSSTAPRAQLDLSSTLTGNCGVEIQAPLPKALAVPQNWRRRLPKAEDRQESRQPISPLNISAKQENCQQIGQLAFSHGFHGVDCQVVVQQAAQTAAWSCPDSSLAPPAKAPAWSSEGENLLNSMIKTYWQGYQRPPAPMPSEALLRRVEGEQHHPQYRRIDVEPQHPRWIPATEKPVLGAEQDEASEDIFDASDTASEASNEGEDVIRVDIGPRYSVRLSEVLTLKSHGFLSEGSVAHNDGHCVVCKFENHHFMYGTPKCNKGILCNRCHAPHEKISRSELRKRNRSNANRDQSAAVYASS